MKRSVVRIVVAGVLTLSTLAIAAPAWAQFGSLKGKVVDTEGKPVADATVVFEYVGDMNLKPITVKTNRNGEWIRAGLQATGGGSWVVTITKGTLGAKVQGSPALNGVTEVPTLTLREGGATGGSPAESKEQTEARARATVLEKIFAEVNQAVAANNFDAAMTSLDAAIATEPACAACYATKGDVLVKKTDLEGAEAAYLKSIELDPKVAGPYDALATLYNQQRKYEQATQMATKATELHGAGAGGGDATSAFNAGVIFWNQGKIPEAKVQFEKALQLNPNAAEAHYYFGMALVNEGKLPEATKSLQQYLTLAPTGPNAEMAKAILDSLK